jgi:hypothetical protein
MNILVLGDSLSFGRPKHNIFPENTWPFILEKKITGRMVLRSRGGADVFYLCSDLSQLRHYYPNMYFDITIVQVGIVDVTPRLLTKRMRKIIGLFLFLKNLIVVASRNKKIVENFGRPDNSESKFKEGIESLSSLLKDLSKNVIYLSILQPTGFLLDNCGDFSGQVNLYNQALKRVVGGDYLDLHESFDYTKFILRDGYHLNTFGHMHVANLISKKVSATC